MLTPVLDVKEGETVYDYAWYPFMNTSDAASCCFITTTRGTPIHLWDSVTGKVCRDVASYCCL
jgi:telomerase Cajal body protein 1